MAVIVALLRGVNLSAHHRIGMETLREVASGLGLQDVRTYVNSGNLVFRTSGRDEAAIAKQIEKAIEQRCAFRPDVILRTVAELGDVVRSNPFAGRDEIHPARLLVTFLAGDPGREARDRVAEMKTNPEELRISGRELYIYYPSGVGRSKLSVPAIEKALQMPGTSRNWNTVTKLLGLAGKMDARP